MYFRMVIVVFGLIIIITTFHDAWNDYKHLRIAEANKVPVENENETIELRTANDANDESTTQTQENVESEATVVELAKGEPNPEPIQHRVQKGKHICT